MGIALLISLFFPYFWVIFVLPETYDIILNVVLVTLISLFAIEIAAEVVEEDGYLFSFFFWADVVGSLSLLFETTWLIDLFHGKSVHALRAARSAKLGIKANEIFRLFGLATRLIQFNDNIVSLFYGNSIVLRIKKLIRPNPKHHVQGYIKENILPTLQLALAMRLAAVVMIMVIVLPFLYYHYTDDSPYAWMSSIKHSTEHSYMTLSDYESLAYTISKFYMKGDQRLYELYVETPWINGTIFEKHYHTRPVVREHENLVHYETKYYVNNSFIENSPYDWSHHLIDSSHGDKEGYTQFHMSLVLDATMTNVYDAMYSILTTLLTIFILFYFTVSFTRAAENFALLPIQDVMDSEALKRLEVHHDEHLQKFNPHLHHQHKKHHHRGSSSSDLLHPSSSNPDLMSMKTTTTGTSDDIRVDRARHGSNSSSLNSSDPSPVTTPSPSMKQLVIKNLGESKHDIFDREDAKG